MVSDRLHSSLLDIALREMKGYVALLPPKHVPLPWLRELTLEAHPAFADHPPSLDVLVQTLLSEGMLRRESESAEVAQVDEQAVRHVRETADQDQTLKTRLHAFYARKLATSRAESEQRVNRVMTGDPMVAATAWTVPTLEVVRARAADDDRIEIVDFGDSTYFVRVLPVLAWENECLEAYAAHEFASDDLAAIEWGLRTALLSAALLRQAEDRVGALHLRNPASNPSALVAGLFWLSLAHKGYAEGGSCRQAWHLAGKAVDILEGLQVRQPNDPAVTTLVTEAKKAQWAYDD